MTWEDCDIEQVVSAMTGRVDGVVVDVADLERGAAFWVGLLDLDELERRDQYLYLEGLAPGLMLILQEVPETKTTKNRMHLEVRSDDPSGLISWVTDNGGSVVESHDTDWYSITVLSDPDGNEFCVGRRPSPARG